MDGFSPLPLPPIEGWHACFHYSQEQHFFQVLSGTFLAEPEIFYFIFIICNWLRVGKLVYIEGTSWSALTCRAFCHLFSSAHAAPSALLWASSHVSQELGLKGDLPGSIWMFFVHLALTENPELIAVGLAWESGLPRPHVNHSPPFIWT